MNARDIERIERELEVSLPIDYREALLNFFLARGTSDAVVWDNPEEIID
jgi:cell wall assembly regulator SMI1